MRSVLVVMVAALATAVELMAQAPQPRVASPELHPDRTVTFRFRAPKASEVTLQFSEGDPKPRPMTKGEDGVWSATVGPVEPEIYSYSFNVDGVKMIDLGNPVAKIGATIDTSVFEVPGTPPRFDELQNVPHGSVNIHTYLSRTMNRQRGLYVYVPAEYYSLRSRRYPVLYLWHGGGGAELDWSRDGRAGVILDNLIAQKKAVPMIVVMPNGAFGGQGPAAARGGGQSYEVAEKETLTDIIPYVEKTYRTLSARENRAIAGLSAGGGISINVGLKRLDTFAWVGQFSSGMFGGAAGYAPFDVEKLAPGFYADPAATNKKLKLLYMSCGALDPRMPFQTKVVEELRSHKINLTFKSFPGVHEWKVWRHSLADTLPLLFR